MHTRVRSTQRSLRMHEQVPAQSPVLPPALAYKEGHVYLLSATPPAPFSLGKAAAVTSSVFRDRAVVAGLILAEPSAPSLHQSTAAPMPCHHQISLYGEPLCQGVSLPFRCSSTFLTHPGGEGSLGETSATHRRSASSHHLADHW
jgi:hypothetical protein